ncbi:hypothetical protein FACS1894142_3830 [Spirochaetia bacterium]|nr:hypothetical protein FACS1894142_3830 [Spirochaetia bacterium]
MGSAFAFTYVMYILFTSRHIDFIDIIFFILFPAVGFMAGVLANCALARILKKMENNPNT